MHGRHFLCARMQSGNQLKMVRLCTDSGKNQKQLHQKSN